MLQEKPCTMELVCGWFLQWNINGEKFRLYLESKYLTELLIF